MKNTTRKKNPHNLPSEKTRWAYWMQAIEPKSEAINKAFPDYHPQWVQLSQKITVSPENFIAIRKTLGMSRKQCAAFLRVTYLTVRRWESGGVAVPFAVFELLRVISESVHFRMAHPAWDGWFIGAHGELNSPDVGGKGFTPTQLVWSTMTRSEAALLRNDVARLQAELDEAQAENTKLRQLFVAQGVVDELAAMQDTINDLMARIATAKVIPFPTAADQPLEKTA
jgi:DNA-binding transcriptional regulator YiaG